MKVKVVSASQKIYENDDVLEVYVPSSMGIMGILKNHTNLLANLEIGIMKIKLPGGENKQILINGGIIQVCDNVISILADEAALPETLVKEEIQKAIEDAEKKLATALAPSELIQLEKQLRYERFKNTLADQL